MSDGSSAVTAVDASQVFDGLDDQRRPLATAEVAAELDCDCADARDALSTLRDRGDLARKEFGGACVWWQPSNEGVRRESNGGDDDRDAEFRALVEAVENYAIFVLDADGYVQTWNRGAEQLKGYSEADIVGEHVSTFYPESEAAQGRPTDLLGEAAETGMTQDEGWRVRQDGERFWAHVTITALYGDDGDVRGFAKITRDLTDRREREEALRRERDTSEQFRLLVESVEEYAIFVMDTAGHIESWNDGAEQLKGYSEDEIVGEHFSTFYPENAVEAGVPERNLDRARERGTYEEEGWRVRKDGEQFWANVTITALYEDGEHRGFAKITRDLTDRKQREDRLAALDDMGRALLGAETSREVVDIVVDAAASGLCLPVSTVALYDHERATLTAAGQTQRAASLQQSVPLLDPDSETAWSVFGDDDPELVEDVGGAGADHSISGGVVVPLGRHGVLVSAFAEPGEPTDETLDFVRVVAADLEAALNQTEREEQLRDRETALADRNDSLERLNRINGVIRRIDQALVDATTRLDVEQAICNELVTAGPYRFAWVGHYDSSTGRVTPKTWSGVEPDYVDSLRSDAQRRDGHPAADAAHRREPQAVADVQTDPPFEPWRKEALRRGHRSLVSVPLLYEDSLYGVLTVQADEPGTFDGMERQVVEELGETAAHAINALESKRALVSDDVVELELRIRDRDIPVLALVEAADCAFEFQTVLSREDGSLGVFFETQDANPEDVAEFAEHTMALRDLRLISERDGECRFEATATDQSFVATLLDQGAVTQSITAEDGEGRAVVTLSPDADVREFVEMVQTKYPDSELTARRTREQRARTPHEFKAVFEEQLTDRQREVLQTAYFSGYFESPRQSTGSDIGDALGVSQPTVNHHLRAAQRVLLGMLYDDESTAVLDR